MELSTHKQPDLSAPGQEPLCQGTTGCPLYLVFLNHPVLVVLGGRLPGDHNCCPVPIVLSHWNALRWSTRSCLFGEKDWMVKCVVEQWAFLRKSWFLGYTNAFFYALPFIKGNSCPRAKMIHKESNMKLQPGCWVLLRSRCAGQEKSHWSSDPSNPDTRYLNAKVLSTEFLIGLKSPHPGWTVLKNEVYKLTPIEC